MAILTEWHGCRLNTAAIARRLGVSRPTVNARLHTLEREGLVRLLPFFGGGRHPLLYLRAGYPIGQAAFRAVCIESIVTRLQTFLPESRCHWWHTGRMRRIDLLVETAEERIGFCFSDRCLTGNKELIALRRAHRTGVIHRGFLLDPGNRAYFTARVVVGLSFAEFMLEIEDWIMRRRTAAESLEALARINRLAGECRHHVDSW